MTISSEYRYGAASVLRAGQALQDALELGDEDEIQTALAELRRVAGARESDGGAVAGFAPVASGEGVPEPLELDDELNQVLAEVNVGQALLAAGSVARERGAEPAPSLLPEALEGLEETTRRMDGPPDPLTAGFLQRDGAPKAPALDVFRDHLSRTVDGIVERTSAVGKDVMTGLVTIPAAALQPIVGGAVGVASALPDVGPLVRAGLRAVQRALKALERLVPSQVLDKVREWAKEWWEQHSEPMVDRVARTLLGAEKLHPELQSALARPSLAEERLRDGYARLVELEQRHERTTETVRKIVAALTKIVGPLAALFAAAAAWLYGIGAAGYLLALGVGVWLGRDYLDTGALVERVPGVRAILGEATA
jgi:hypothetical protein